MTGAADRNANVIFGAVIDDAMGDEVRVTVIATGFDGRYRRERRERQVEAPVDRPRGEREREPSEEGDGFDVPAEVLEVPSFLRDE